MESLFELEKFQIAKPNQNIPNKQPRREFLLIILITLFSSATLRQSNRHSHLDKN